ncbi:Alpha/Beta hydrolase protein [Boletus coccyginus]|nr:Alpha/Beta hydrolase protein [Boletus coccyginus]
MSASTPLTDEQRKAVSHVRAMYTSLLAPLPFGTAESVDARARLPEPGKLPADFTARVEIAPPSPHPHPLLPSAALKAPERVPVYFYALGGDPVDSESDAGLADTRVLFFIHGGGNVVGHPADPPKCVFIAPSYRLATVPENAFPAALQDILAAYDYVLGKGYSASNVVLAGDSAGGNHALVLTHLILQSNRPPPRGVAVIAPGSIQSFEHMSEHAKAQAGNDILDVSVYVNMTTKYISSSGVSRTDPLVSGSFLPFGASWPKTLILHRHRGPADRRVPRA